MCEPDSYRAKLTGCDSLFHTAAYFRDSLKGGKHWQSLYDTNVKGTEDLLQAAYESGIRCMVHTSSIAVLHGKRDQLIDETMSRPRDDPDDYYRSKIMSDEVVNRFLAAHPDMFACFVLPVGCSVQAILGPLHPASS